VRPSLRIALVLTVLAPAAAAAQKDGKQTDGDLLEQVRQNRQRLMGSHAGAPPPSAPSVNLDEATRRLREAVRRPIVRPKPADEATTPGAEAATVMPVPAPAPQRPTLSPEQLSRIQDLPLKDLGDPLALADSLFLGDHLEAACTLYERLLAEGSLADGDKAWCLFQAAGCKRPTDPAGAIALYDRLLTEHPDSLWTEAANARKTILQWRQKALPEDLLTASKTADTNATTGKTAP